MAGLEPLGGGGSGSSNGSSSSNSSDVSSAASLALPLWAFHFNRTSGSPNLHLYNVTIELPVSEFSLLLAGLSTQAGGAGGTGGAPPSRRALLAADNAGGNGTNPLSFIVAGFQVRSH